MKTIPKLRLKIDAIDQKIICLIEKRFILSDEIGDMKTSSDKPIKDPSREKEILAKLKGSDYAKELTELYKTLFTLSKARQFSK